jgi:hypothetical protein
LPRTEGSWYKVFQADGDSTRIRRIVIVSITLALIGLMLLLYFTEVISLTLTLAVILALFVPALIIYSMDDVKDFKAIGRTIKEYFLSDKAKEKNTLPNFIINMVVVSLLIVIFVLSPVESPILARDMAFYLSILIVGIRVLVYLIDRTKLYLDKEAGRGRILTDYSNYILTYIVFLMIFNLVYSFNMFMRIGIVTEYWQEIVYTIDVVLATLVITGVINLYLHSKMKREKEAEGRIEFILDLLTYIIVPIVFIVVIQFIPFDTFDLSIVSGQTGADWFAYVFYILFQHPLPAFMIAFMTVSAIGVIMAQNLGKLGSFMSAVAIATIAIVPMIVVMSAITGSVDPPPELQEILGLDRAVASFIYGMGLVTSYVIVATILGTFIASARLFNLEFD